MGFGAYSPFSVTMTSGATLSSEIDIGQAWESVYLAIPTMTSNTNIYIQASSLGSSSASPYRRVKHPPINSSTVGINDFVILSAATNCMVPIPNGFRYLKVETTATVDSGCTFQIICGR